MVPSLCTICKPVRLPKEVSDSLHILPDPVPGEDGHFKSFENLLGTKNDERHRPSLQEYTKEEEDSASVQHVNNVDLMLQCDECGMWRLLYSKLKLTKKERADLEVAIEDVSFSCSTSLQDLELSGRLDNVYTRVSCRVVNQSRNCTIQLSILLFVYIVLMRWSRFQNTNTHSAMIAQTNQ